MSTLTIIRARLAKLTATVWLGRRSRTTSRTGPAASQERAYPQVSAPETANTARERLVAAALRLAAASWNPDATTLDFCLARTECAKALASYVFHTDPQMMLVGNDQGDTAIDDAYRAVQKATLHLASTGWPTGQETASDAAALDHAYNELNAALAWYIALERVGPE